MTQNDIPNARLLLVRNAPLHMQPIPFFDQPETKDVPCAPVTQQQLTPLVAGNQNVHQGDNHVMPEETKFDAVQFGRLIQSVETLTSTVSSLSTDIRDLQNTRAKGWGILTGVALVAGGLGSASHAWLDKILR